MKVKKSKLFVVIASLIVLVASLVVMLCDALIPLNFWVHPALNFVFCLFVGFGVICMVLGFVKVSPWHFFLSAILLGLALIYALSQYIVWWIGLIIVAVIWAIFAILSFLIGGGKTEDIALNKSPNYKTYDQRKSEKEKQNAVNTSKELPEIKSFK